MSELATSSATIFPAPNNVVEFRSTGFIFGKYFPGDEWVGVGTFETEDGSVCEAKLTSKMAHVFQRNLRLVDPPYLWSVWVKTDKFGNIRYTLKHFLTSPTIEEDKLRDLALLRDLFSIRGQLASWNFKDNSFLIRIKRNEKPKPDDEKNRWLYKAFAIKIYGRLPGRLEKGQFWELNCVRNGTTLMLDSATLVKPPRTPKSDQPPKSPVKDGKPVLKNPPVLKKNLGKQPDRERKPYQDKNRNNFQKVKSRA